MTSHWITVGALYCGLAVVAGAFGAHGLKNRLGPDGLALWETAARYFMYSGLGIVLTGLARLQQARAGEALRGFDVAAGMLSVGAIIFSGTVAVLALGGPRWLGAVTPFGGLLLILGFVIFGATSWRL